MKNVKDVMTPTVHSVRTDVPLVEAAQLMKEHDIGILPVLDGTSLQGTVTDRDLVVNGIANGVDFAKESVGSLMTQGCVCCQEGDSLTDAAQLMQEKSVQRVPVQNDDGDLVGMVTLHDLAQADETLLCDTVQAVKA